jgi:hypothetical protein
MDEENYVVYRHSFDATILNQSQSEFDSALRGKSKDEEGVGSFGLSAVRVDKHHLQLHVPSGQSSRTAVLEDTEIYPAQQ